MSEALENIIDLSDAELVFADGTVFEGFAYGIHGTAFGPIRVLTAATGYQESLSDPSFTGAILLQSFPHAGNTGVNAADNESAQFTASGFIVKDVSIGYSNFRAEGSLEDALVANNVVGIHGVDTRAIARRVRGQNVAFTGIFSGDDLVNSTTDDRVQAVQRAMEEAENSDPVLTVTTSRVRKLDAEGSARAEVAVLDFGIKYSLVEFLTEQGLSLTIYPANTPAQTVIDSQPDAIIYASGPVTSANVSQYANTISALLEAQIPIYGFGSDNLIFASIFDLETESRPFGYVDSALPKDTFHRSFRGTALTSSTGQQSHDSAKSVAIEHYRLNDYRVEGVRHLTLPISSQQVLRERSADKHEMTELFANFIDTVLTSKEN